ncbi:unnamed protein product [Zymoseptoria tritici ST99CH_3D7]|uniref:Uncharacterized protein n=1 Tax=Zymoseptoria tritici (strain ST99CH_3D7) TaxID=1276538 RepID=A0A1X7S0I2_ZYMT9|nr:unnamed protein product [Zymoseptoria tritici ST99CH_3D7]
MADLEPAERARLIKLGKLQAQEKKGRSPTALRCINDAVRLWALAGPLNSGDRPEAKVFLQTSKTIEDLLVARYDMELDQVDVMELMELMDNYIKLHGKDVTERTGYITGFPEDWEPSARDAWEMVEYEGAL